jgi:hypothetical protein
MTEKANSPKAREFERHAAKVTAQADALAARDGEDDAVVRYLRQSIRYWERRAKEIQTRADRRAATRAKREGRV